MMEAGRRGVAKFGKRLGAFPEKNQEKKCVSLPILLFLHFPFSISSQQGIRKISPSALTFFLPEKIPKLSFHESFGIRRKRRANGGGLREKWLIIQYLGKVQTHGSLMMEKVTLAEENDPEKVSSSSSF